MAHLWMQFIGKYPNKNLHHMFDLHIQKLLSLNANDDDNSKA
jgi:hypothetical protein